ncbi:hypothetical protein [Arabiibacter massiliensis]|uniref:hypothetical protein n=1 Tax=Arabiibacter massiliensis TaxID=1870985 RepID=UPI0009BC6DF3|nr:hypothetical protein [Arabiibacter massiliensis]
MRNREWVYAVIAVISFVMMAASLVFVYMDAGEAGPELGEFVPAIGFALVFLVNLVLSKQNRRR